jgi:hypothetical protein
MTEEIDLDELDVEPADEDDESNPGDWFWHGEGDPPDDAEATATETEDVPMSEEDAAADSESAAAGGSTSGEAGDVARVPHVPRENKDKPVGIPKESGGAGADTAAAADATEESPTHGDGDETASGPHGGGVDDMTLALTYGAMKQFAEPLLVVQDARAWADWVGIVGDVEAFVINKFQREHDVDVDFFSGAGQTAAERLADIGKHSMFYAERMVLVGLPEEREIAERADWEFIPLSEATEKAGWELADDAE